MEYIKEIRLYFCGNNELAIDFETECVQSIGEYASKAHSIIRKAVRDKMNVFTAFNAVYKGLEEGGVIQNTITTIKNSK